MTRVDRRVLGWHSVRGALEALVVKVSQVSDQAATLGELSIAKDAAELSSHAALESHVTDEVALRHVRPRATGTLPFPAGVPYLAAHGASVTVQGEDVGVTLAAARAHVRLVRLREPRGRALKEKPWIRRTSYPRWIERSAGGRVVREVERRQTLQVRSEIRLVLWKIETDKFHTLRREEARALKAG